MATSLRFFRLISFTSKSSFKTKRRLIHSHSEEFPVLKEALKELEDISLGPLRVKVADFEKSFSDDPVYVLPYCKDGQGNVVEYQCDLDESTGYSLSFLDLFKDGKKALESFVNKTHLPESFAKRPPSYTKALHRAVSTLECYLKNIEYHQRCLEEMAYNTHVHRVSEITALLATHLFAPLVTTQPGEKYKTSESIKNKVNECPCGCGEKINYGNSTFGSKHLWYGRPDILLFPPGGGTAAVVRPEKPKYYKELLKKIYRPYLSPEQIKDVKDTGLTLNLDHPVRQAVSQAITFSFAQKFYQEKNEDGLESSAITTLIPTISASSHSFDVYFYDAVNDVLLKNDFNNRSVPFFKETGKVFDFLDFSNELKLSSVLQLWMLINHLLLQPKLSDNQLKTLKDTCGFKKEIEEARLSTTIEKTIGYDEPLPIFSTISPVLRSCKRTFLNRYP